MLNSTLGKSFHLENRFVGSTLPESPSWYSVEYQPTFEYPLSRHFDILGGATFKYTLETEDYNTFEIRETLGSRIHFTPQKRLLLRAYLRVEQRNFLNLDTDEWDHAIRPRARLESLFPINKPNYSSDKVWYAILDVEWLFKVEDVEERFANRFRFRAGLGYRLSHSSRFEFIYMNQESRSGIDDDFESTDHIFRFRYKHFMRKTKPVASSGSGD
jgi:hypothetical protein